MGRLIALLLAEASLVALVHRETASRLADPEGLLAVPPGDLVIALLHAAAWLAAWWLLLGTAHDLVVRSRGAHGRRVAPRWVQRIVGQAVGTAMVVGVVAGPVGAATAPTPPVLQVVTPPVPPLQLPPPAAPPAGPAQAPAPPSPSIPVPPPAGPGQDPAGDPDPMAGGAPAHGGTHVVAAGENLWTIARQQLLDAGLPHADRDVHARWIALIRANAGTLPSGDPDLIHPGDLLQLPAAPEGPEPEVGR